MWPQGDDCGIDGGEARFPAVSGEDWKRTLTSQWWQEMALEMAAGQEVQREKDQADGPEKPGCVKHSNRPALLHCNSRRPASAPGTSSSRPWMTLQSCKLGGRDW